MPEPDRPPHPGTNRTAVTRVEDDRPIFNRAVRENLGDFTETENIVQGSANDYAFDPDLTTLTATSAGDYRTRMIVRRPESARSNGTVMVEWLNPTAMWDGTPMWDLTRRHLVREGVTWVGVTIKPVALDFLMNTGANPFGLEPVPEIAARYADLDLFMGSRTDFSGEGLVWDMMNDITAYLRDNAAPDHPLAGIAIEHVMQGGYSQSGGYLVTHANWFHQDTTDSYFIAAAGGAHQVTSADDEGYDHPDPRAVLRERPGVPMVRWQTETEPVAFGRTVQLRPAEQLDWVRWWEVAGGAHAPIDPGGDKGIRDVEGFTGFGECANLFNGSGSEAIQTEAVAHATIAMLESWVRNGIAPPPDQFLDVERIPADGYVELKRDEHGNALGGIRLPAMEAPTATYTGTNHGADFCFLFGSRLDFDQATLDELYPDRDTYLGEIDAAIDAAIETGFLLPDDAAYVRAGAVESFG